MKEFHDINKEPAISKIILLSTAIHLLFISLVLIPIKVREKENTHYYVTLIEPLMMQTDRERQPAGIGIEETAAQPFPKTSIGDTIESIESIEKVSKEIQRMRAIKELSKKRKTDNLKTNQIKREKVLSKTSRTVDATITEKGIGKNSYYTLIIDKIRQQWIYPDVETSELEVIISIKVDKEGNILSQEIERSSGNTLFDRSAIKAISKATPLPPPHKEMEIGVRFYL